MTVEDLVSVIDAAKELGLFKQTLFKVLKRLGIATQKHRHSGHRGQAIAYITGEEFARVREYVSASLDSTAGSKVTVSSDNNSTESGWFYLVQVEPEHDPGRFKVGFASNMTERLRQHKCAAPFARLVEKWPCLRKWEQTAIDCVTQGCQRVGTEVFRTENLDQLCSKCASFFSQMPPMALRQ
jgi:hypothetical protein